MKNWARALQTVVKKALWHEKWNIGVVRKPIAAFLDSRQTPTVEWLDEVPGGFLADPFGYVQDGSLHILCEKFDWSSWKGHLVELAWPADSGPRFRIVKESSGHLSYPYILRCGSELWVVPEQWQSRRVDLYRWSHEARSLERVATIIEDFAALDSSIVLHEGTWWLFCADGDEGARSTGLHVWYSGDLRGPWKPHPCNPVKRDIRSARPAGTPFVHNDKLYRPAQDCSRTYGGRIVINEILRLTKDEFQERCVAVVEPDRTWPYPDGTHTLSAVNESLTLIDAKVLVFHPGALPGKLMRRLRRGARAGAAPSGGES